MNHSLELLDATTIYSVIGDLSSQINHFEILESVNSTNTHLMIQPPSPSVSVCIAEQQTEGRGRRGRHWLSPPGGNLYLSLGWHFKLNMTRLTGLTLAVGVAITKALNTYGLRRIRLKWPNDVFFGQRKLAGILVEIANHSKNTCQVVIGIGLNIYMPEEMAVINQPWIDVYSIEKKSPDRNQIAGLILRELLIALPLFQEQGLAAFHNDWLDLDCMRDQTLIVQTPHGEIEGIGAGIDEVGNLLLWQGNTLHKLNSGEVKIRFRH